VTAVVADESGVVEVVDDVAPPARRTTVRTRSVVARADEHGRIRAARSLAAKTAGSAGGESISTPTHRSFGTVNGTGMS
jgi:hypothetical protein